MASLWWSLIKVVGIMAVFEGKALDSLLVARKLARFCPTSLSIDDFRSLSNEESKNKKRTTRVTFIPPSSSVSAISENVKKTHVSGSPRRFACLMNDIKQEKEQKNFVQMKYELPNMVRINTPSKSVQPIMAVSLSCNDLQKETAEEKGDYPLFYKKVSSGETSNQSESE
ncbi:hypothetical protein GPJ56_006043 [Histomonas meleagridis]|uniref:uncharacterized protein n=1 Tax=Histomonas meleagridis TaxID=135588 RepID=UPI00355A144B|nr:hypothetical protein GPJ56_006043 [Histomonas meleagridis]KAH0807152.1 hypothetical protein GO595_000328 [Histomonas meleagridis]